MGRYHSAGFVGNPWVNLRAQLSTQTQGGRVVSMIGNVNMSLNTYLVFGYLDP